MPITYQYLTDRTLAQSSAITPTTLIHIVTTGDTSQNAAGSSYKAELQQLSSIFSGLIFTGGSSNCISDLYVSNIHSCSPLLINPNDEGNVYFGSTSGITLDVINKRIGINTNNPQHSLHISGNTKIDGGLTATTISATTISGTTLFGNGSNLIGIVTENYSSVTYSELYNLLTGETLNTGSYYLINDFQTCYDQPDYDVYFDAITSVTTYHTSTIEPLLVLATSANTISNIAYQPSYPNDKITYDWTWNITEVTNGPAKGRITERVDEFNNRTDYDHRNILFKRYRLFTFRPNQPLNGTIELLSDGTISGTNTSFTALTVGDVVYIPTTSPSYYEIVGITGDTSMTVSGDTITAAGAGQPIFLAIEETNDSNGYFSYNQTNIKTNDFIEYTTFGDAIFNNYAKNNYVGNFANNYQNVAVFILTNNVFLEGAYESNKFGDYCHNNTFGADNKNNIWGDYCYRNVSTNDIDSNIIGHYFYDNLINVNLTFNHIGNDFNNNRLLAEDSRDFQTNIIGNEFNNNTIYSWFYTNEILNNFNNNIIGDFDDLATLQFNDNRIGHNFSENTISQNFYKNEIGYGFNHNQISGDTYTNKIGEEFYNNTIYSDFYDNQIFNEFKGNITYQSFYENILDWGFGSNQFSGICSDNAFGPTIDGNDFLGSVYANTFKGSVYGNTIGDNFSDNNIGFGFSNNIIGENFGYGAASPQGNIIGNNFINNIIGEYFYNNSIPDNFNDNIVGNYFQWNFINTNIDYTDFTLNYGNITGFSYTATGTGATDNIYTNLTGITNGYGVSATFDVDVSSGTVIGVSASTPTTGYRYQIGDTITILGTDIGGTTPEDNIVITVTDTTSGSSFYQHYTKQIFERRLGNKRVSFYDEYDILNVDSVYEISGYITVYSQPLSVLFPFNNVGFEFECNGGYSNDGGITIQTTNNIPELLSVFNNNFRQFGYFFDNNDGTIGLYINPSLKEQYCPSGTYTISVSNN